ncbi:acetate--CoA ligase family protein [Streptomyces sp. NPDC002896]|uniref:acetate--CoA ligase family protein n=1 Tax=Streptomyces sp. NPDC002896 TaxID=3154438 RepID=UPI003316EBE1
MTSTTPTPRPLTAMLRPANIVIVGASDKGPTARQRADLTRTGYAGAVYPVNPRRRELWDGPCYADLASLPQTPDHVILSIPATAVPAALEQALAAGARSVAIHAAGFGEGGDDDGRALADKVRAIAAGSDVPVTGGSFGGFYRQESGVMTLSLSRVAEREGSPVALVGQSGGVLMFTYEALMDRAIRPTTVVASGSELLVGCADFVAELVEDDATRVVACFVESIKDLDAFGKACLRARELGKHIVVLKVGASPEGRAAALAHTGSVVGSLEAFEALAAELGVVTVSTQDELVDAVELLLHSGGLPGPRIGVISHSGGLKDLVMDYASRLGITFPKFDDATIEKVAGLLGTGSSLGNPLDTGFPGLSNPDIYRRCVEAVAADPNVDVVLVQEELPRSPLKPREEKYLRQLAEQISCGAVRKPVGAMSLSSYSLTDHARSIRDDLDGVFVLQEASRALAVVTKAGRAATPARRAERQPQHPDLDAIRARLTELQRPGVPTTLSEHDSKQLLASYGIPVTSDRLAQSAEEAVKAAEEIGFPVVLKVTGAAISHKSEIGGVLLDLRDGPAVREAFDKLAQAAARVAPGDQAEVLVSEFVSGGVELVLGLSRDLEVGPVVAVGSGGVAVEILDDVAVGLPPFDQETAAALLARTKAGRLVGGYRNAVHDIESVHRATIALGALAADLGDLVEAVDINPLTVTADRACALDALVVLSPAAEA